jgi:hypothetical protein
MSETRIRRSSYVRNYCSRPEISENRYIWEVWIGNEFSRKKEIITSGWDANLRKKRASIIRAAPVGTVSFRAENRYLTKRQ